MNELFWSEEIYGTGDPLVDQQHQELFKRVNMLSQTLEVEEDAEEVIYFMEFLEGYVRKHFKCEEEIMERKKCSACKLNKNEHAEFLKLYAGFKERFSIEGPSQQFGEALAVNIRNWIRANLAATDTKLRETGP